jgi:hypothetical protein
MVRELAVESLAHPRRSVNMLRPNIRGAVRVVVSDDGSGFDLSPLGHAHLGAHGVEHDVAVEPLDLPVA